MYPYSSSAWSSAWYIQLTLGRLCLLPSKKLSNWSPGQKGQNPDVPDSGTGITIHRCCRDPKQWIVLDLFSQPRSSLWVNPVDHKPSQPDVSSARWVYLETRRNCSLVHAPMEAFCEADNRRRGKRFHGGEGKLGCYCNMKGLSCDPGRVLECPILASLFHFNWGVQLLIFTPPLKYILIPTILLAVFVNSPQHFIKAFSNITATLKEL